MAPWKRNSDKGGDGFGGGAGGAGGAVGGGGLGGSPIPVTWKARRRPMCSYAHVLVHVSAPLSDPRQSTWWVDATNSEGSFLSTATGLKNPLGWYSIDPLSGFPA